MRSCLRKQVSIFPLERDHLGMCALKEDLLSIMHIIICLTKVTIWLLGGFWLADPTRDPPSVRIPREIEDDNADIRK